MVRIDKKATRLYVLDTNVLIHDPAALYQFDEHEVVIPMTVLEELDKHKNGIREIARTARQVSRTLSDLTANVSVDLIREGIPITRLAGPEGRLRLLCYNDLKPLDPLDDGPDNRILAETCRLRAERTDASVILVTKDINLRVKATALGVPAEDYLNDRVFDDSDAMIDGARIYPDAGHDGSGPVHLAFAIAVEDVAAWDARLAELGISVESRVRWSRGGISIYFRDPDNRSVELATPGIWPCY